MPSGVYKRTAKHIAICSKAGIASANKKRALWQCKGCKVTKLMPASTKKKYCSVDCHNKAQTFIKPTNYFTIHDYIRRNFGTPSKCEHCDTDNSKKFEWANISGEYRLERSDWARLCVTCHRRYDFGVKNKIGVLNV